ncbi:MAG TPA: hypothetical protein PLS96_10535 [Myxococcota bacterium]|nr:hypothetical protein [Myxococcota bacterium]HQE74402.1 hypothetical protein [Myxococcota bacterium]HQI62336.1 hypothetical protein [Myxococcota bacterium]HRR74006.1 hypothetical protein [Myxococcota bacterium]HRV17805.1 hypothetical protein [Myxococcota bacterium]
MPEQHKSVRCPICWGTFRRHEALYECRSQDSDGNSCAEFGHYCDQFLRSGQQNKNKFIKTYRCAYNVDFKTIIKKGWPWERQDIPGRLFLFRPFLAGVTSVLPIQVRCPRCKSDGRHDALHRVCPLCGHCFNDAVFLENPDKRIAIGLIGTRRTGKTCLLISWLYEFWRMDETVIFVANDLGKETEKLMEEEGTEWKLPDTTKLNSHMVLYGNGYGDGGHSDRRKTELLFLHDLPGEDIDAIRRDMREGPDGSRRKGEDTTDKLKFTKSKLINANRLCLIVDGSADKIRESARQVKELLRTIKTLRQKATHRFAGGPGIVDAIAICVTKIDEHFEEGESRPSVDACNQKAAELLRDVAGSMGQSAQEISGKPDAFKIFGVSALGQKPYLKDRDLTVRDSEALGSGRGTESYEKKSSEYVRLPIRPIGVKEMLEWLKNPHPENIPQE